MSVPLPAYFGKYQLLSHIAAGGMADVYLGRLVGPGGFEKRLVVKVIRPELAQRREFCEMFVAEAKITVALSHANIVPVYELGVVDGQYFLAMELIDGPTVHQLIFGTGGSGPGGEPVRVGPVPPPLAAYIVEQVLRGLDYAHRNGVVHRDLSSANVLCSRDGEVKIVDFGIAAHYHAVQPVRMKGGSAGYMAPEQARGEAPDARSDLYAAGVLLGEVATGKRFAQLPRGEALQRAPYHLPAALQAVIDRATAEDKEARFSDAEAMLLPLSRYLREGHPVTQADLSRVVRKRSPEERRLARGTPARLLALITDADVAPDPRPEEGRPERRPEGRTEGQGPRTRPIGPARPGPARRRGEAGRPDDGRDRSDPTPLLPLRPPTTTAELAVVPAAHRPVTTGDFIPVPLLEPMDEHEARTAFATPLTPRAPPPLNGPLGPVGTPGLVGPPDPPEPAAGAHDDATPAAPRTPVHTPQDVLAPDAPEARAAAADDPADNPANAPGPDPGPSPAPSPAPNPAMAPAPAPAGPGAAARSEGGAIALPPPGGTVIFASRPARTHATWRTYAGGALLVLGAALAIVGARGQQGRAPLPSAPAGPAPATDGVLSIQLPPGATLKLDGQLRDAGAPLRVPPGRHRLEAQAPGRRPLDTQLEVRAGETLRERLHLPWAVGSLRLESTPEAAVTLDGEPVGQTPLSLDVPLDRAATLRLSARGHAPLQREILPSHWAFASPAARLGTQEEAEGRQPEMRLQLQLEPLGRGLLTVGATPWAQVFVDGERKGDTPLRRLPLPAGSHTLRLYCPPPGCLEPRELRQSLVIEPGRELRRIADFRKTPIEIKE